MCQVICRDLGGSKQSNHTAITSDVCVSGGGESSIWTLSPPEAHFQQLPLRACCQTETGSISADQTDNREERGHGSNSPLYKFSFASMKLQYMTFIFHESNKQNIANKLIYIFPNMK